MDINEEELIAKINELREKSMRDLSNILDAQPSQSHDSGYSLAEHRKSARKRLSNNYHTTLREMMSTINLYNQHFENKHMRAVENYLSILFRRMEEAL